MVASIGVIASPSQGVSYYEKDDYYAKDDPAHKEASAWAGKGAETRAVARDCVKHRKRVDILITVFD